MHPRVHLIIATSWSMIITFVIHSIMQYVPLRNIILQRYYIEYFHSCNLYVRCIYNRGMSKYFCVHPNVYIDCSLDDTTCGCLFIVQDVNYYTFGFLLLAVLMLFFQLCFDGKRMDYFCSIILTPLVVEYLVFNVVFMIFWHDIDVLTVYLFVWQFISLGFNWLHLELLPPIFIIEQGSFCIMAALFAWITDQIFLRYLFREVILVELWLLSLYDM